MTKYEDDFAMAKRHSIVTDPDRCHTSSSEAPHAPLKHLHVRLDRAVKRCEELEEDDGEMDPGRMAKIIRGWADDVFSILANCNAAEKQRSNDAFKAIDWYNANLQAGDEHAVACYEQGKEDSRQLHANAYKKAIRTKLRKQKQMYEAKLAELQAQSTHHDGQHSPTQPNAPPTAPYDVCTDTSAAYDAQIAFWKGKYDRLADTNAELRNSTVEEPAVQNFICQEVEKIKKHYELQIQHEKGRTEMMSKRELQLQLQERASPSEKRKADNEMDIERGRNEEDSPKRVKNEHS